MEKLTVKRTKNPSLAQVTRMRENLYAKYKRAVCIEYTSWHYSTDNLLEQWKLSIHPSDELHEEDFHTWQPKLTWPKLQDLYFELMEKN